jgi:hypothetical protein
MNRNFYIWPKLDTLRQTWAVERIEHGAIHELSKEPPPFKTNETHIALLRWQTILPSPLKPAETYWRPPEVIENPDLRGEVHSGTMFVYAGLVVLFIWLLGRFPSRLDPCALVPKDRFAGRLVVTIGSSVIGFWLAAFLAAHLLHLYIVRHW